MSQEQKTLQEQLNKLKHERNRTLKGSKKDQELLKQIQALEQEIATQTISAPLPPDPLRDAYLNWLLRKVGYVPLAEIDPKTAALEAETRLNLDAIYTALLTVGAEHQERMQQEWPAMPDEKHPLSALAQLDQYQHLVLLGDPGSGKSTFVNFVVMCLAGELLGDPHANLSLLTAPLPNEEGGAGEIRQSWTHDVLLPVRVILRDFATRGLPAPDQPASAQHLWAFLAQELEDAALGEFVPCLKDYLRTQGGLILFDGLDEVPDVQQRRRQIKQVIEEFASVFCPCHVLVTSRTYAYQEKTWQLHEFREAVLAPFTRAQIRCFVNRWYQYIAHLRGMRPDEAHGEAHALQSEIFQNPRLRELAERPLLLTLMTSLHASRGRLPHKRVELYRETVELLLDRWERRKFERKNGKGQVVVEYRSLSAWLKVDKDRILGRLQKMAYKAHAAQVDMGERTADIPQEKLALELLKISPDKDLPQRRLEEHLRDRAGLLVLSPHEGAYTFPHRSFQEYLAACYLTSQEDYPENVVELVRQDPNRWREVVLLAAARVSDAAPMIWALVEALCYQDVAEASVTSQDVWGALLAGQALAETANLHKISPRNKPKLSRVRDWLVAILTELTPKDAPFPSVERALAGNILAILGDPRPGVGLREDGLPDIEWCEVPAGSFLMGSDPAKDNMVKNVYRGEWEQPQHEVHVSVFQISRYPVTNAQYQAFVEDGGKRNQTYGRDFDRPNHPVVGVSWHDAVAFCEWLTLRLRESGELTENQEIRLPTEAEWEKAARGTDGRIYSWGDNITPEHTNYNAIGLGVTSAVGCFPCGVSQYGCKDMTGNVWEWCQDWFDENYYAQSPKEDPQGPVSGSRRVVRGGGWANNARYCRAAARNCYPPDFRNNLIGFRLLRTPSYEELQRIEEENE